MPYLVTAGDTVKLRASFRDWDGILTDPTTLTFTAYDEKNMGEPLITETLAPEHKVSPGVYEYLYHVSSTPGVYFAEFNGTVDGDAVIRRLRIEAKLVAS